VEFATQILLALAVPGALAALLWWLQRRGMARFASPGTPRRMQVVERLPLSAQHALHLVRIEDKLLIVASAPGGCTVLGPMKGTECTDLR
jgi:flagellar biogenesis protein FliO